MQLAIIEFARNVLDIKEANSTEFDKNTKEPIIFLIDEFIDSSGKKQIGDSNSTLGGTMRLGEYECNIKRDSLLFEGILLGAFYKLFGGGHRTTRIMRANSQNLLGGLD